VVQRTIEQHVEMTVGNTSGERIRWARIQKGWLIKRLAAKVGINPATLSNIERKVVYSVEMKTLRKLATELEQPIWYLGCFENMHEDTFFEKIEKARCYHGHTKVEMASEIGVHARTIFDWKDKEPSQMVKEKALLYCKILD
jgi:transcriptional regulator with XRE-family HTH domain